MSRISPEEKLTYIERFAIESISAFGLHLDGWSFGWDRAKRRFGCCDYSNKRISISRYLVGLNSIEQSKDTVLHEIAHAIAGKEAGHGPVWAKACRMVGAKPERCYNTRDVHTPQSTYVRYCPNCHRVRSLYRKSNKKYACGPCCKKYNNGLYSPAYALRVVKREEFNSMVHM